MSDEVVQTASVTFGDHDLVYVDPESRSVVGRVEWTKTEKPKSRPYVVSETLQPSKEGKPGKKTGHFRKHYPWGTYKSMRRVYRIDGKMKDAEPNRTLDEVLPKALESAFWD